MTGYVQVYTGDGKGKTTAALGLILRARGADLRVYLGQFIKKGNFSEIKALKKFLPNVVVEQYGLGHFIKGEPSAEDLAVAAEGIEKLRGAMKSGDYDVVVADEINPAVSAGLFPVQDVLALIDDRPEGVELVLTGRNADQLIIDRADLVTEMKNVKHYMDSGVAARPGIES